MSEETKRPRGGEGAAPFGMRARNRTMVMGSEKIDSLRGNIERPVAANPSPNMGVPEPAVDASSLDVFGSDEFVSPQPAQDDAFMDLGDVLGASESLSDGGIQNEPFDPFAFDEVEPSGAGAFPNVELKIENEPINFDPLSTASQSNNDAAPSQPKFVRSVPAMTTPPKNQQSPNEEDVFDPFSSIDDAAPSGAGAQQAAGIGDDFDSMFGDLPAMEEVAVVAPAQPKIVRPGELGSAHERVIIPPPPPQAAPIHIPAVAPAAGAQEKPQASKEAEVMTEPRDRIHWKVESPLVGFLVTYDHDPKGSYVELRQGRLMVSNQREESGSCLVVLGESISPMHAIMRVAPGGVVQVLDQLSEAGTRVKHMGQEEEEFLSGEKSTVSHGDIIFFGDRKFHVLLVIGEEEKE